MIAAGRAWVQHALPTPSAVSLSEVSGPTSGPPTRNRRRRHRRRVTHSTPPPHSVSLAASYLHYCPRPSLRFSFSPSAFFVCSINERARSQDSSCLMRRPLNSFCYYHPLFFLYVLDTIATKRSIKKQVRTCTQSRTKLDRMSPKIRRGEFEFVSI